MFRTNHSHFPWDLTRPWPSLQSKQKTSHFLSYLLRYRQVFPVVQLVEKRKKKKKQTHGDALRLFENIGQNVILNDFKKTYNPRTDIPQWFIQLGVIFPEQLLNISVKAWVCEILGAACKYCCELH